MSPSLYKGFSTKCVHVGAACSLPQWLLVFFASVTLWFHSLAEGIRIPLAQLGFRAKAGNGRDGGMTRVSVRRGGSGSGRVSSRLSHGRRTDIYRCESDVCACAGVHVTLGTCAC